MLENLTPAENHTYCLPPLQGGFIDLHFNGNTPPKGKTRYGLVVDVAGSTYRWNINFEVLGDEAYASLAESPNLSEAQQAVVFRTALTYVNAEYHANRDAFLAPAKRNHRAGKSSYHLEYDYTVSAILDLSQGLDDPIVILHWGNETYLLAGVEWYSPATPNTTIRARYDLR